MKKVYYLVIMALATLTLAACRSIKDQVANQKDIHVGILQYMEHDSLSSARKGFEAELEAEGYKKVKT